jgi:hypothetical protein
MPVALSLAGIISGGQIGMKLGQYQAYPRWHARYQSELVFCADAITQLDIYPPEKVYNEARTEKGRREQEMQNRDSKLDRFNTYKG